MGRARFRLSPPPQGAVQPAAWALPARSGHRSLRSPDAWPYSEGHWAVPFSISLEQSLGYVAVPGNSIAGGIKVSRQHWGGWQKGKKKEEIKKKTTDWQIIPSYEQYVWTTNMCSSTFRFTGSDFLHYLTAVSKSPNPGISLPSRLLIYHENNLLQFVHRAEEIPNKPNLKPAHVL